MSVQLSRLGALKRCYGVGCAAECERCLAKLRRSQFADAESLLRFHDTLLFLRAFPHSAGVVELTELLLAGAEDQVRRLRASGADLSTFDDEAVSGVAGTTITNSWTYELARWLVQHHSRQISPQWNIDEQYRHMATILPDCMPLFEDDSFVEADTPYLKWMRAAAGGRNGELAWLLRAMGRLSVSPLERTSLYDALEVDLQWDLSSSPASRTLARRPLSRFFYHDAPLLQRKQVSLAAEMASTPLKLRKLSRGEGREIINMTRDALAVRYRELHGTTHGSPQCMFEADGGRGVRFYLWSLPDEWRLPLRGYFAGITIKNGVPINYIEAIGLFEWLEVGFNTFYAYREGETAWIYSKVLHLLHQLAGATCFSIYPYQIGQDNEEAIQSGAFWFYRKLGFRPGRPDLLALAEREEKRIALDPEHRTSARTLRKLAEGHMFFELSGNAPGCWDSFSVRTIGLAVLRKMAARYDGNADKMRRATATALSKTLGVGLETWNARERWAFSNFAVALSLVPGVPLWTSRDKRSLVAIIRAKAGPDETRYLRLMQRHEHLREVFLRLGSVPLTGRS